MALTIVDRGARNIVEANQDIGTGTIVFDGDDNRVALAEGVRMDGGSIRFGSTCSLDVGSGCRLQHIDVFGITNARIIIGRGTGFTWMTRLYLHEPGSITIGRDCLIASETLLMNSDVHSIFDLQSDERVNAAADVIVGDHVWIAEGVRILKGTCIGSGSVIGAGSIVTSDVPINVIAGGIPARVLRKGVRWSP